MGFWWGGGSKGGRLLGNRSRSWERSIDMVRGKGKVHPRYHEGPDGGVEV